jgi:NADPH-dependent ferric siderophore reductase
VAVRTSPSPGPPTLSGRPVGLFRARVSGRTTLGPHLVRISLTGPDLARFHSDGPDQRVKLLLPRPGQDAPHVDADTTPRAVLAMSPDTRPVMRTYTVRAHRPETGEVDIDFVLHGAHGGPASQWAATAQPGAEAALYGPVAAYRPPETVAWQLIVGDDTALPAIGAITEQLTTPARIFIEVGERADRQPLACAEDAVTWLYRGDEPAGAGTRLLDAVRAAGFPDGAPYAWLAGEQAAVRDLRRHLVGERGFAKEDVYFCGYWRRGRSEEDA